MWILQTSAADEGALTFRLGPGTVKTVGRANLGRGDRLRVGRVEFTVSRTERKTR